MPVPRAPRVPVRPSRLAALLLTAPLLAASSALHAQSSADATLCERIGDARHADARSLAQQGAQGSTTRALFLQGCLALADQQWARATDRFEDVVRAADGSAIAHFWLGQAYGAQAQRANMLRQASLARKTKSHFERAVELDPGYVEAREGLLQYYLLAPGVMGGSVDRARAQAAEIRRRNPYRGALAAARIAARQKDVAGAEREYRLLAAEHPDSTAGWFALFGLQVQQKRWDDAAQTLDAFQRAQPSSPVTPYLVGRLAAESGQQLERGEQALRRYLTGTPRPGEPSLANAHWRLGMVLERQGRRDAARAAYQDALRLDPSLKAASEALAKLR